MSAISPEFIQVNPTPKVTVCVVTYNQKGLIAQCLQSLVDQQTDFPFEILVADDCSTDGTSEVVEKFVGRYPGRVVHWRHEANVGAYHNYIWVHAQAAKRGGCYIAHMDGDDYALPGKLQTQADILDRDRSCNLVWTPVLIEVAPGQLHEQNEFFKKHALGRRYTRAELIKYGTVGTNSSKMYRKLLAGELVPFPDFEQIDYFVNVIQVGEGVACFSGDKPLGVYRLGVGVASSGVKSKILTLRSIEYFSRIFPQYRVECSIASCFRLLLDIKNRRLMSGVGVSVFLKTFHWRVLILLPRELRFLRCLTLRKNNG